MIRPGRPQRVLLLCTANVCRSPTAEYLARDQLGSSDWIFRSAGFLESGRASSSELIRVLDERGIDLRRHRSYKVDLASLQAADLVITMEGSHVQRATALWPGVLEKIVPLRQAATLIDSSPVRPSSIQELLQVVVSQRDHADYLGTRWDVADPFGRSLQVYRRSVAEIESLMNTVLSALT